MGGESGSPLGNALEHGSGPEWAHPWACGLGYELARVLAKELARKWACGLGMAWEAATDQGKGRRLARESGCGKACRLGSW